MEQATPSLVVDMADMDERILIQDILRMPVSTLKL